MSAWAKPRGIVLRSISGKKETTLDSGAGGGSTSRIGWRACEGRENDLVEAFGVDLWRCAGGKTGMG